LNTTVNPLWVVADTSGSMGEAAKLYIMRNMINYIRERLSLSNNNLSFNKLCVVTWNEKVKSINIDPKNDLPAFKLVGKVNVEKLTQYFDKIPKGNIVKSRLLILSDWKLEKERKNIFINWAKQQNNYSIRVIQIEIGISAAMVNKMSSRNYFHPQDISKALYPWELTSEH
jgi:hypothetical protein